MLIFDMLMRPADSFWKRRWMEEAKQRRRFEANATCERGLRENAEEELRGKVDRLAKQAMALDALGKRVKELEASISAAEKARADAERECELLRECLRSEREAKKAMQTSARLWESIKGERAG